MIDFLPDAGQQQILDSFVEVLAREAPVARLRKRGAGSGAGDAASLWNRMAELGWLGLGLAEADGGVGLGISEEMLLLVQAGRHLLSPALLSTVMGAHLAAAAGQRGLAGRIISGSAPVGLATATGPHTLGPQASGSFHCYDATGAGLLLAWDTTGIALFEAGAFGERQRIAGLDENVLLDSATLREAKPLAWLPAQETSLQHHATVLNAAMLVGVAQGAQELAVAYAKTREQFGRPIGAFQAIKHICADMAVRSEAAASQTIFAALSLREARADAAFQAASAKTIAVDAATENSAAGVRVHGGMGFTAECEASFFLKRAHILNQAGDNQRRLLAELLRHGAPA